MPSQLQCMACESRRGVIDAGGRSVHGRIEGAHHPSHCPPLATPARTGFDPRRPDPLTRRLGGQDPAR